MQAIFIKRKLYRGGRWRYNFQFGTIVNSSHEFADVQERVHDNYFPNIMSQQQKAREFTSLILSGMTLELEWFTLHLIITKEMIVEHLQKGQRLQINAQVAYLQIKTFKRIMEIACIAKCEQCNHDNKLEEQRTYITEKVGQGHPRNSCQIARVVEYLSTIVTIGCMNEIVVKVATTLLECYQMKHFSKKCPNVSQSSRPNTCRGRSRYRQTMQVQV